MNNSLANEQYFVESFLEKYYKNDSVTIIFIADFSTAMSIVLNYVIIKDGISNDIFIKRERVGHKQGILEREYENLLTLNKNFSFQYKCAEIITFSEKENILVLKACQGENVFDLVSKACKWPSLINVPQVTLQSIESLGKWLNYRESVSVAHTATKVREKILLETKQVETNLNRYAFKKYSLPLFFKCKTLINDNLSSVLSNNNNTYLAHGDFHPGNFFVDDNQIVSVIDFQHVDDRIIGYDALYFEMILLLSFGVKRYNPLLIRKVLASFQQGYSRNIDNCPHQKLVIKALITMRALVYLSSIYQEENTLSKIINTLDLKKLKNWLFT